MEGAGALLETCVRAYHDEGFSEREARAATSLDLGHRDGCGRYVASVMRAVSEDVCFRLSPWAPRHL
jgi:hypothetical protein